MKRIKLQYVFLIALSTLIFTNCGGQNHNKSNMNNSENQLAKSSSPYLRQHANNPVNWYEWGKKR